MFSTYDNTSSFSLSQDSSFSEAQSAMSIDQSASGFQVVRDVLYKYSKQA